MKPELSCSGYRYSFTISKSSLTSFSDSPRYLEVSVEEETLKKVVPHSVATALASSVLPVPGGPTISTPYIKEEEGTTSVHLFLSLSLSLSLSLKHTTYTHTHLPRSPDSLEVVWHPEWKDNSLFKETFSLF